MFLKVNFLWCYVCFSSLSQAKGVELAEDMKISYRGIGMESIFLMFQKPWTFYIDKVHDQPNECAKEKHTANELVECFINKAYRNKAYVPGMFIPSCGQVSNILERCTQTFEITLIRKITTCSIDLAPEFCFRSALGRLAVFFHFQNISILYSRNLWLDANASVSIHKQGKHFVPHIIYE